jgi:DNA-binding NtrC family response regulator
MKEDIARTPRDDDLQADATARLLLVADDPTMDNSLAQFLKLEGYQADTAADGSQAIVMLASKRYRLVLMEVINGLMLMSAIRKRYPEVMILVMTGCDMIERAEEAVKRGAFAYLVRPIIDDEIRETIQRALEQREAPTENYQLRQQPKLRLGLDSGYRWWRRLQSYRLRKPPGRH